MTSLGYDEKEAFMAGRRVKWTSRELGQVLCWQWWGTGNGLSGDAVSSRPTYSFSAETIPLALGGFQEDMLSFGAKGVSFSQLLSASMTSLRNCFECNSFRENRQHRGRGRELGGLGQVKG